MRCIGTLEFLCDFYDGCHRTQKQLLQGKKRRQRYSRHGVTTDFESNKENSPPKRVSLPEANSNIVFSNRKITRSGQLSYGGKSSVAELKNGTATKRVKRKCKAETRENENELENVTQLSLDNTSETKSSSKDSCQTNSHVETANAKIALRTSSKRKPNPNPVRINVEHLQSENKTNDYNAANEYYNEEDTSPETKVAAVYGNPDEKIPAVVLVDLKSQCSVSLRELPVSNVAPMSQNVAIRSRRNETISADAPSANVPKALAVIVKQESVEQNVEVPEMKLNPTAKGRKSTTPKRENKIRKAPRRAQKIGLKVVTAKIAEPKIRGEPRMDTESPTTKSVIEMLGGAKTDLNMAIGESQDGIGESESIPRVKNDPSPTPAQQSTPKPEESPKQSDSVDSRRKKAEGQFGKLSELISNEQKEIIESLYHVDMGVVNEEEVQKNMTHLDKSVVKCNLCNVTYTRLDKCQVHVWGHLNMKPFRCNACDFVTLTVTNIRCHIRKRHLKLKPFQCNLCEKSFVTAVLLEEHINSHTGAKPYKCNLCNFAGSNRQALSYHRSTHKPVKDIQCEFCPKTFYSKGRMRAHIFVHKKDKNLMCKLCSTYLCNTEALVKHYQKAHSRDYVCNICGCKMKSSKALHTHQNVHSPAKHKCPMCPNVYKSRHILKEHILKHEGIRKYKCNLCLKSFGQQSHLAAHMSIHIGKRYPCPGCKMMFNRVDNLRIHTRRCKMFNSDPTLVSYWTNRKANIGDAKKNDSTDVGSKKPDSAELDNPCHKLSEDILPNLKTDSEKRKTDVEIIELTTPKSKTDYDDLRASSEFELFQVSKSIGNKVIRIGEVDIFPTSRSNSVSAQIESNVTVTEKVLKPECF